MSKINGIYAASISILNEDLSVNVARTISHCEKIIKEGCHGVAIFGSTGQSQLISVSEKIKLLNELSKKQDINNYIVGTGLNSLIETINFLKVAISLKFKKFLIMPPAFYKYGHEEVINFYSKLIESVLDCEIILYNFEKLSGYQFNIETIKKLVEKFPKQIVGIKDTTGNIFEELNLKNFSILPGSETQLLKGLEIGCSGVITATCNVNANLARKVYDDFISGKKQTVNQKLCEVRNIFEKNNVVSSIHSYLSKNDSIYKNLLPPLSLLSKKQTQELELDLKKIKF